MGLAEENPDPRMGSLRYLTDHERLIRKCGGMSGFPFNFALLQRLLEFVLSKSIVFIIRTRALSGPRLD